MNRGMPALRDHGFMRAFEAQRALRKVIDGEDAAVVIVGLVQVQLGEDAADVFLDGALGDPEPPCDAGVGASFCHQFEHLAFSRGQRGERVLAPAGGHQLPDQRRVHDRAASGDPLQRVQELVHIGDAALEQVADAASASQQLHRVLDLGVSGQHQDGGSRQFLTDHPGRLQPFGRVRGRHPDVGHYQVGPGLPGQRQQLRAVTGLPRHLIAGVVEQTGQALAEQDIVLGQHHPQPGHDGARPVPSGPGQPGRPVLPLLVMLCIID